MQDSRSVLQVSRSKGHRLVAGVSSALLLLSIPLAGAPRAQNTDSAVITVENPAPEPDDLQALSTEKLWRIGGDSEDEDQLFGFIGDVIPDDQDRVYLLDLQLCTVSVFDAEGTFIRRFGAKGEGPGEFQNPIGLFLLPDDRLAVIQTMPPKVSILDRDGTYVDDLPVGGGGMFNMVTRGEAIGGRIVIDRNVMTMGEDGVENHGTLMAVDIQGKPLATYYETSTKQSMANMEIGKIEHEDYSGAWLLRQDQHVIIAPFYDRYELQDYDPDGHLTRIVRRDYEPVRFSQEEKDRRRKRLEAMAKQVGNGARVSEESHQRAITKMVLRPGGELWILPGRSSSEEPAEAETDHIGPFDVFDRDGHLVGRVQVQVPYDVKRDAYRFSRDRLYVIENVTGASRSYLAGMAGVVADALSDEEADDEEAEPLGIVCYRLVQSRS